MSCHAAEVRTGQRVGYGGQEQYEEELIGEKDWRTNGGKGNESSGPKNKFKENRILRILGRAVRTCFMHVGSA